jgi:hypothetical protein
MAECARLSPVAVPVPLQPAAPAPDHKPIGGFSCGASASIYVAQFLDDTKNYQVDSVVEAVRGVNSPTVSNE